MKGEGFWANSILWVSSSIILFIDFALTLFDLRPQYTEFQVVFQIAQRAPFAFGKNTNVLENGRLILGNSLFKIAQNTNILAEQSVFDLNGSGAQHVMRAKVVCVFEYGGWRRDVSGGAELGWRAAIPLHLSNKCSIFGVGVSHSEHLGSRCRKSLWWRTRHSNDKMFG